MDWVVEKRGNRMPLPYLATPDLAGPSSTLPRLACPSLTLAARSSLHTKTGKRVFHPGMLFFVTFNTGDFEI